MTWVVRLVEPGANRATRELLNRRPAETGTRFRTPNLAAASLVRFQLRNPGWLGTVIRRP